MYKNCSVFQNFVDLLKITSLVFIIVWQLCGFDLFYKISQFYGLLWTYLLDLAYYKPTYLVLSTLLVEGTETDPANAVIKYTCM